MSNAPGSDALALQRFENLIRARSGLHMREQEAALLGKTLVARVQAGRFSGAEIYLDWLSSDAKGVESEWSHLFVLLTNQESYFFRDPGQLGVVRDQILPEIIRSNSKTRALRIWSAGCSTGEEAYSLAMMLEDALPPREEWRVLILGTDISEAALERARSGIYSAWSFRGLDAGVRARFFQARGNKWEVGPRLRRNVRFRPGNLLLDAFPSRATEMHDMDLIVCRNVFIYFGREAVSQVLAKFSASLRPGGTLVTGHAELHDMALADLQVRTFPQTVVYQRASITARQTLLAAPRPAIAVAPQKMAPVESSKIAPVAIPTPASPDAARIMRVARAWIEAGRHPAALQVLAAFLAREPRYLGALCLAAQAQANAGQLDEAETFCRRAIEVAPFAPLPYHLLARIAAERDEPQAAKALLKKVIYLSPASVRAYLELSAIYLSEGDAARAAQMQAAALDSLEGSGQNSPIPAEEHAVESPLTVGELKRQLQSNAL